MTIVVFSYCIICVIRLGIMVFNRNTVPQQLILPAILMTIFSFIASFITCCIEFNSKNEDKK